MVNDDPGAAPAFMFWVVAIGVAMWILAPDLLLLVAKAAGLAVVGTIATLAAQWTFAQEFGLEVSV